MTSDVSVLIGGELLGDNLFGGWLVIGLLLSVYIKRKAVVDIVGVVDVVGVGVCRFFITSD